MFGDLNVGKDYDSEWKYVYIEQDQVYVGFVIVYMIILLDIIGQFVGF